MALALLGSVATHSCLFALMPDTVPAPVRLGAWQASRASGVQALWTESLQPPPSTDPPPQLPIEPKRVLQRPIIKSPVTPSQRREPEPADADGSDVPRVVMFVPASASAPVADQRTDALIADETQRVSSRVGTWLSSDVSRARVRGALVDPAYGQLGEKLRSATRNVPRFIDTNSLTAVSKALIESWASGGQKYARTGAPYEEPAGRLVGTERPSEIAKAVEKGSPKAQAIAQFLAAGARLQEFADGRAGVDMFALVELRQSASGAVTAKLNRSSGLAPFDAWVLERAREVASTQSDAGSTRELRSVWRFDGRVLFQRKLGASDADAGVGRAALGVLTMVGLSALSSINHEVPPGPDKQEPPRPLGPRIPGLAGRFDGTGLSIVDLTNPTYECTVQLMEAD